MLDSHGVLQESRKDLDENKILFMTKKITYLEEAMNGADVFLGLSKGNIVNKENGAINGEKNAIVSRLRIPILKISYEEAAATRQDIIIATGESDYPNQVNNVLGFPFIFVEHFDVRATQINETMKLAAVRAIAELAKEPVPEIVNIAYNKRTWHFGMEYIIPKPLDPRLITTVAPAVAKAAMDSGVAQSPINNWSNYADELNKRLGLDNKTHSCDYRARAKQNHNG